MVIMTAKIKKKSKPAQQTLESKTDNMPVFSKGYRFNGCPMGLLTGIAFTDIFSSA